MGILNDILKYSDLQPAQLMAHIDEYEALRPYDCMIDTARAVVLFFAEDYEGAKERILRALQKNPASHMNHFYYALISKALGEYAVTAVECWKTINFATQFGKPQGWDALLEQLNAVLREVGPKLDQDELEEFLVRRNILQSPGSFFPIYRLIDQNQWSLFTGKFLYYDKRREYNDYVAFWGQSHVDLFSHTLHRLLAGSGNYNAYAVTPTQSWKARQGRSFAVREKDCVLSVAATAPNQTITMAAEEGETTSFTLAAPDLYHYVNIDKPVRISSDRDFILSKPIPTQGKPGKKRLVLTIFMDALSQRYLTDTDFEHMPYTREFFGKGTIFKNCYATGEWTHPSVAALTTGLYTTHHHVTYRSSAYQFPPQTKTVSEIFQDDGYFTVSVSGSVGTSPYLGGLRGYDSAICKSCMGFPDGQLIEDALDFLEAFPHTNRYLSLGLFDVHRALEDSSEHALDLSMPQQTIPNYRCALSKTNEGQKSVWMHHSENHVQKYQAALRDCDRQLKKIYDYLVSHFKEEDYIVCFYSDHGTPVLSTEDYLLKTMQTNSVLMLRGGGVPAQISEEYVNHFDCIPVLAKLAGIPFDFSGYDCVLPRTFGGPGRDFVYSESIYHGQSYKAAVRTEDFEGRFETNGLTENDGLIDMSQGFTLKVTSMRTGEEIQDQELAEDFEAIVFDHIKENIKY